MSWGLACLQSLRLQPVAQVCRLQLHRVQILLDVGHGVDRPELGLQPCPEAPHIAHDTREVALDVIVDRRLPFKRVVIPGCIAVDGEPVVLPLGFGPARI